MKFCLPLLLFLYSTSFAQSADFIILKKNNRTIKTFHSGMDISFTASSGAMISAHINGIQHDTLYLQEFIIRYLPTTIGTYIIDTAGSYRYQYHYKQVVAIGQTQRTNFNMRGSGASLMGGCILLTLGSGIVYLADRKKFSAPLLIASAGLATLGYFMAKGKKRGGGMVMGKKYKLQYMDMSNKKT